MLDTDGIANTLRRFECENSQERLGVFSAPDGNMRGQIKKMEEWAEPMRAGRLQSHEAWILLTTTIWKTLEYPLLALSLTKLECEKLMAPAIKIGLQQSRNSGSFKRDLIHATTAVQSGGLLHLYTTQEIAHVADMVDRCISKSMTGELYTVTLEQLILKISVGNKVFDLDYDTFCIMATPR